MLTTLPDLITRYKSDPESVYNTWFINSDDRLKAFRAIRTGVGDIVQKVGAGIFGNDFKGSALEFVLTAITEQKQVFEGAAHAFYWKPKLRIPDIYENELNKQKFAAFLQACLNATEEEQVLAEMSRLADAKIKGLGPAAANIVYFLHPTFVPPFNTAMLNGFNALFSARKKLGSWESYLEMREMIVQTNNQFRHLLSKDLGAFAGLLFEIGTGRLLVEGNVEAALEASRQKAEKAARIRHAEVCDEMKEQSEHTHIQHCLIQLGRALKYKVHVARNDRHRSTNGQSFALSTVPELPSFGWPPEVIDTVSLIDVIWISPENDAIVSAFEVEKSTSIYSGILRMEDLARSIPECKCCLYLVAPKSREAEVMAQLARPAFRDDLRNISISYIPFDDLTRDWEAMCRFGEDHRILQKICRCSPFQSPAASL